jgi:hypothetical protein
VARRGASITSGGPLLVIECDDLVYAHGRDGKLHVLAEQHAITSSVVLFLSVMDGTVKLDKQACEPLK